MRDPPEVTYMASRADIKYVTMLGDRLNGTAAPRKLLWLNRNIISQVPPPHPTPLLSSFLIAGGLCCPLCGLCFLWQGAALLQSAREGIQEGLGLQLKGGNSPSSGFVALHTALHMCEEVNVFGFSIGVSPPLAGCAPLSRPEPPPAC